MKKKHTILVIDDEPTMTDGLKLNFQEMGYSVLTAATGEEGVDLFENNGVDLVITDLNLPDMEGFEVLEKIKALNGDVEVIMVTGYGSVDRAIEAVKKGAFYFVEKPFEMDGLQVLVERAMDRRALKEDVKRLNEEKRRRDVYYNIVGRSKSMQSIFEMIESVAGSDANILIAGESGTGKEMIANAIHQKSARAKRAFVKVNCAALPKDLIESELFGHTKGAFTGATRDKEGLIGAADGGSLLLDEIAEMPVELQPKLLRVLQERQYYRLGSEKAVKVDFRLITATNRDPKEAIKEGVLREDLYYRIATITIVVPPLRDRAEDIPIIADHFLKRFTKQYDRPISGFTQEAYDRLFRYGWPGNVRELESAVERAVLLSRGELIDASSLPFAAGAKASAASAGGSSSTASVAPAESSEASDDDEKTAEAEASDTAAEPEAEEKPEDSFTVPPGMTLEEIERSVIYQTLKRTKGNKQAAANALGIYRPRLYSKIKKYNITEFM